LNANGHQKQRTRDANATNATTLTHKYVDNGTQCDNPKHKRDTDATNAKTPFKTRGIAVNATGRTSKRGGDNGEST
jgi:hypothetical protein